MSANSSGDAAGMPRRFTKYADTYEAISEIVSEYGILHTIRTAARLVRVSRQRIHQLLNKGKLTRFVLFEEPYVSDWELWTWARSRRGTINGDKCG